MAELSDGNEIIRAIRRAKICTPADDEYVDECPWSRTGWAIWERDGGCTCRPAKKPGRRALSENDHGH